MSTINEIIKEALDAIKNMDDTPSKPNNVNFKNYDPTPRNLPKHLNGGNIKKVQFNNEHAYKSGIGQSNLKD